MCSLLLRKYHKETWLCVQLSLHKVVSTNFETLSKVVKRRYFKFAAMFWHYWVYLTDLCFNLNPWKPSSSSDVSLLVTLVTLNQSCLRGSSWVGNKCRNSEKWALSVNIGEVVLKIFSHWQCALSVASGFGNFF